jgi:hypothetical protein
MAPNADFTPEKKQDSSQPEKNQSEALSNRRDLARRLGRFAAYAAPVTMLLMTDNAKACIVSHCP